VVNVNFRVVLDACVLANFGLCDLFLTLAETPRLYQPVWSREILDEVQRAQVGKLGWPGALSKSWREAVESAFPEAKVTVQESLVAACANHEKDRHVLAASIRGHAELIVTSNLKHFVTGGNQVRDRYGDERDRKLRHLLPTNQGVAGSRPATAEPPAERGEENLATRWPHRPRTASRPGL
jgi:predicted nucleic acid-binding protein